MSLKTMSPHYRNKMDFVRGNLTKLKGKRILDLGCGFGEYLELCRGMGLEAWGLDLDSYALKNQRGVVRADAERIPFKSRSFDIVICTDMLEHVSDDKRVIGEVKRLLKKGGVFILSVPSRLFPFTYDPINALLRPFGRKLRIGMWGWGHKRLYLPSGIKALLEENGFEVRKSKKITHAFICLFMGYLPYLLTHTSSRSFRMREKRYRESHGFLVKIMDKLNSIDKKYFPWTPCVAIGLVAKPKS